MVYYKQLTTDQTEMLDIGVAVSQLVANMQSATLRGGTTEVARYAKVAAGHLGRISEKLDGINAGIDGIIRDIETERIRQDKKWGGPSHDDKFDAAEFEKLIDRRMEKVVSARLVDGASGPEYRRRLVQVAALCVAAIERYDRG